MKLKDLNLPKKFNLDILRSLLSEEEFETLIYNYIDKTHSGRRIILPSHSCLRKCLIYHLVKKHKRDFTKVMRVLREKEGVSVSHGRYITNIKRLFEQRKKEIANEQ